MTKAELINLIADGAQITRIQAESALNELATQAREELRAGRDFSIPEIGKLKTAQRAARTGRNPKTGDQVEIPAKTVVKFSPAKDLREGVAA